MIIADTIQKLKGLGYVVSLNGGDISLDFIGNTEPSDREIKPLVDLLRKRKHEAVEYLAQNNGGYLEYFENAVKEVNRHYVKGAISFVKHYCPELYKHEREVDRVINGYWDKDFERFTTAVDEWVSIHTEIIRHFKEKKDLVCVKCGAPFERVAFGQNPEGKFGCYRWCLKCRPHSN